MASGAETLCQACGLCCDGALFTRVPLSPGERVPGQAGAALVQPCPALERTAGGCRCLGYAERPGACRGYQCLLAIAFRGDEVSLSGALEVAGEARRRIEAVGAALEAAGAPLPRARALRRQGALPTAAQAPLARAEAWLELHFLGHGRRWAR